jgi:hypothetical protein
MGKFVDDYQGGGSSEGSIDVKFMDTPPAMGMYPMRQNVQALEEGVGFLPAVRFHNPDNDVDTFKPPLLGGLKHCIGLTHTRGGTEEDLQLALVPAFLLGDSPIQEFVGIRSFRFHHLDIPMCLGLLTDASVTESTHRIQRHIQVQDMHSGFAENAELPVPDIYPDQCLDFP